MVKASRRGRLTSEGELAAPRSSRATSIANSEDLESFVSAMDTVADLADFEDLGSVISKIWHYAILSCSTNNSEMFVIGEADPKQEMYVRALDLLEKDGIPYR